MNPNTRMKTEKHLFIYQDLGFVTCWYLETSSWTDFHFQFSLGMCSFFFLRIQMWKSMYFISKTLTLLRFQTTYLHQLISFSVSFSISSTCLLPLILLAVLGVFFGKETKQTARRLAKEHPIPKSEFNSLGIQTHTFSNWYFPYI